MTYNSASGGARKNTTQPDHADTLFCLERNIPMKNLVIAIAVLLLLGSTAYGGWYVARDGWLCLLSRRAGLCVSGAGVYVCRAGLCVCRAGDGPGSLRGVLADCAASGGRGAARAGMGCAPGRRRPQQSLYSRAPGAEHRSGSSAIAQQGNILGVRRFIAAFRGTSEIVSRGSANYKKSGDKSPHSKGG